MYSSSHSTLAHFVSIYDPALFIDVVFQNHQGAFDGITSFKVYLYPVCIAYMLKAVT